MAGHQLIEGYLAGLAARLPAAAVEELADGLTETYHRQLSLGLDPDAAAGAAVAEFGAPDLVVAAFVRHSPGRRAARVLICSGPVVGACWAATLLAAHAWTWPVPGPAPPAFGLALLAVIGTLVAAATGRRSYRRTRLSAAAGIALIALDTTLLGTVLAAAPAFAWPMALAVPASLARIAWTAHLLPRLLTR